MQSKCLRLYVSRFGLLNSINTFTNCIYHTKSESDCICLS